MERSWLTPEELGENPELAVLRVLKTNLDVAELALLSSYPRCEDRECSRSEEEAYAMAILYQMDALGAMLQEYVESVRRRGRWQSEDDRGDSP